MDKCLLHIKVFSEKRWHDVWIQKDANIGYFILDIQDSWLIEDYAYEHIFYHCEANRFLVSEQTWEENYVCSGDHLILF